VNPCLCSQNKYLEVQKALSPDMPSKELREVQRKAIGMSDFCHGPIATIR
jgi:hypothetical protein